MVSFDQLRGVLRIPLPVLVVLVTGCIEEPSYEGRACSPSLPCPGDLQCVDSICAQLVNQGGEDGGVRDGGAVDAGDDGCLPCDERPRPECSDDDQSYSVFLKTAECSSPGRCEFTPLEFPCEGCAVNCLAPCAEIDCDDLNDCRIAGYCAPDGAGAPPSCTYLPRPNGTLCDLETGGEGYCAEGACLPCTSDADCDDQNDCTRDECDTVSGSCAHEAVSGSCDDEDACTRTDTCEEGVCVGGDRIVCDQPSGPCQLSNGVCSPEDGSCSYPPDPTACNDHDPCTIDTCDPMTGACSHAVAPDGTICTDQDLCTATDVCSGGVCIGTEETICNEPPNDCYEAAGTCDSSTGVCSYDFGPDGVDCDDRNACTQVDTCMSGMCLGGAEVVCDDPPSPCHEPIGTCDPMTGTCSYAMKPEGASCDDGNACTQTDSCQGGVCVGENPVVCDSPPGPCKQSSGSCDPGTGACSYPNVMNGASCDDQEACTYDDLCTDGVCSGTTINCNDTDCKIRSCNGTNQCTVTNRPSGYGCTDDGNTCTRDVCNASGSCTHPNRSNGTSCGSTPNRRCCGGSCVNIANDENHCGGCFTACDPGFNCEPIQNTPVCGSSYPSQTSGRCRCSGANAHCPDNRGQVCRLTQYNDGNRCVPDSSKPSPCAPGQTIQGVSGCPAYCAY